MDSAKRPPPRDVKSRKLDQKIFNIQTVKKIKQILHAKLWFGLEPVFGLLQNSITKLHQIKIKN